MINTKRWQLISLGKTRTLALRWVETCTCVQVLYLGHLKITGGLVAMKLFYSPGACSMAPHMVIEELGLKCEWIKVDLAKKQMAQGDFFKVNPLGQVPALELDNGQVLTEAAVILQYLADQKPEKNLMPKPGTFERFRVLEWLNFIATELHKGFGPFWNPKMPDDAKTLFRERLESRLSHVNQRLNGRKFVLGDQPTIADFYLFTVLGWAPMLKFDLTRHTAILGFLESMNTRPAVVSTLRAEGLI